MFESISRGGHLVAGFLLGESPGGTLGKPPGGMTYEAAIANNNQQIDMNGRPVGPDLTNEQLAAPMRAVGQFLATCGAPDGMEVTVRVAVKLGRPVGVTVETNPPDSAVVSCLDHAVRGLRWPSNPKMDSFVTKY